MNNLELIAQVRAILDKVYGNLSSRPWKPKYFLIQNAPDMLIFVVIFHVAVAGVIFGAMLSGCVAFSQCMIVRKTPTICTVLKC